MDSTEYHLSEDEAPSTDNDDDDNQVTLKFSTSKHLRQLGNKIKRADVTNPVKAANEETQNIGKLEIEQSAKHSAMPLQDTTHTTVASGIDRTKVVIPIQLSYKTRIEVSSASQSGAVRQDIQSKSSFPIQRHQSKTFSLTRGYALFFIALLAIVVFQTLSSGPSQFIGAEGWAYVLGGPQSASNTAILKKYGKQTLTPSAAATPTVVTTPEAYVNQIISHMTLDQKLGQMMLIQFVGPNYSLDLSTMVKQYGVGTVLIFAANQNIQSKSQLTGLISQMQNDSALPLAIAIDQEGGTVDRLVTLDGPRPSETTIGATGDPNVARQEGIRDAQDLSSYGINLNLAPVVDVTNVYNAQLDQRTYGNTANLVTKMASAYLDGLQQSGKVLGTLKHFPGLGDVSADPHSQVPVLTRSLNDLESIDWAPYRSLLQQGNSVHAIMVTHEIVQAVDSTRPSSLSSKVVTGILRDQLGFNGVIITDSLTMESVTAYYDEGQAAALAVEAGCDLLMGASTPSDVAKMLQGIKQAIASGQLSQQRIDESVRRILLMKYEMGLLAISAH